MYIDEIALGKKITRNKSLIRWLKSLAVMPSGSLTLFLPENSNELCGRMKLLLREKRARNNANKIIKEIVAIFDKPLKCICKSKKQYIFLFNIRLNCLKSMSLIEKT